MSRSAAARTHHEHHERALRRHRTDRTEPPHGAGHARRVSGPVRPAAATAHAQLHAPAHAPPRPRGPARRPPLRLAAGSAAIALRVADSAVNVSTSRTMDRLVRSRAWVVIIGVGLIGIVAMQVSMLKLNAGIGRAVEKVATLERTNASLKGEVSRLSAGDRIQALAGQRGFVMPEPADVTYLRAGDKRSDGLRAVRNMGAPDPSIAGPAGAVAAAPDGLTGATGSTAAGAGTGPTSPAAPTTAPATAPAATATSAPATPGAPPAPATSAAPPAPATSAAPPATATSASPAPATSTVTPGPVAPQTTSAGGVTPP